MTPYSRETGESPPIPNTEPQNESLPGADCRLLRSHGIEPAAFRFILDGSQIYLVILPDELTSPANARLNAGIVMHHFVSVMHEKKRPKRPLELKSS